MRIEQKLETNPWAATAFCTKRLGIPHLSEFLTIVINELQEESMKKPEVTWLINVKIMVLFQSTEECPPASGKVVADFNPVALYSGIMRRAGW